MNETFDAGEALRLVFECIHQHLGDGSKDNCPCPLHPACQQRVLVKVKCKKCGGKSSHAMDQESFTQIMYAYEWLTFAEKEDKHAHENGRAGQPMSDETAILLVRG